MPSLNSRIGTVIALAASLILPTGLDSSLPSAAAASSAVTASEVGRATATAKRYLRYSAFSKRSLIDQLIYEKFSRTTATRAVDSLSVNWNQQAVTKGKEYFKNFPMSQAQLLDQLRFEGFTEAEVGYARRHLFPSTRKPAKPTGSVAGIESRTAYSKTADICDIFSGSGRALIVTKGTSCAFSARVTEKYNEIIERRPSARRSTVRFTAKSSATHRSYPVVCKPLRFFTDINSWRYHELTCASGKNYRAKISETVRIYS